MLLAQALVSVVCWTVVTSIWNALMQAVGYVGEGNNKWVLIGLALVLAFVFLRPRRR